MSISNLFIGSGLPTFDLQANDLTVDGILTAGAIVINAPTIFDSAPKFPVFAASSPGVLAFDGVDQTSFPVQLAPGSVLGGAAVTGSPSSLTVTGTLGFSVPLVGSALQVTPPQNLQVGAGPTFLQLNLSALSNQLLLGASAHINIITAVAPVGASQTVTIPDSGQVSTSFVLSSGSSTISGARTFSSPIIVTPVSNQLVLGAATPVTLSASVPAAIYTAQFTDPGFSGVTNVLYSDTVGVQSISGPVTFATEPTIPVYYSYRSRALVQSIPDNVDTSVDFDEDKGTVGIAAPIGNAYVAPVTGRYQISYMIQFDVNAVGSREVYIQDNTTTLAYAEQKVSAAAAGVTILSGSATLQLTALTDSVSIFVLQNSGGALDINNADKIQFSINYLGKL